MATYLNQCGTVSGTDLKDSWDLRLVAGKTYHFEAKNTDDHGRFNLVIEYNELDYGEVPIGDPLFFIVRHPLLQGGTINYCKSWQIPSLENTKCTFLFLKV